MIVAPAIVRSMPMTSTPHCAGYDCPKCLQTRSEMAGKQAGHSGDDLRAMENRPVMPETAVQMQFAVLKARHDVVPGRLLAESARQTPWRAGAPGTESAASWPTF